MRYFDSGRRDDPSQALGFWLREVLADDIASLRLQTGFFSGDGLAFIFDALRRLTTQRRQVRVLIGSNEGATTLTDVQTLVRVLGIPRTGAQLAILRGERGALYHPKTCHIERVDGTQAAYVGSANFTGQGLAARNVEAGVLIDSRQGDPVRELESIATAVDQWFDRRPEGMHLVQAENDLSALVDLGVLTNVLPSTTPIEAGDTGVPRNTGPRSPSLRLRPLVQVPPMPDDVPRPSQPRGSRTAESRSVARRAQWKLVWRSNQLSERDLNIPKGNNTNPTGSIGLRRGDWHENIDHRHYFRDDVFSDLLWRTNERRPTREVATALFEVWIRGRLMGETALVISHNTDTRSRTYEQRNEMTHLSWGEAKQWVANRELLGDILELFREAPHSGGVPKFKIEIKRSD